jgi:4-amino-4-deoxy-L-arabinose transferase-like glycosyltransferase
LGAVLIATALSFAAVVTRSGLISLLLASWVVLFAEMETLALVLSPIHQVGRTGYAVIELALLAVSLFAWKRAGRPRPRVPDLSFFRGERTILALALGVLIVLLYELLLCLTLPPNNWDSLTYHLARTAAWYQHGGVYWIPNAPTERQNAFPAGAELAVLWSFVAGRSDRVAALPQFLAQGAAIAATYGIAVRIGATRSGAAFAALLVPTLAIVALESTTTQNDLVAASFVATAAYFVLVAAEGEARPGEAALGGVALALAVGTKLTVTLALPGILLIALAARLPRRSGLLLCLASGATFAALNSWVYVVNVVHTRHLLGHGGGRVEHSPALTPVGWVASVFRIVYRFLDLTAAPSGAVAGIGALLALTLILAALVVVRARGDRFTPRRRLLTSGLTAGATALALPLIVALVALCIFATLTRIHFPIAPSGTSEGPFTWHISRSVHEDFSYAGPLGLVLLAVVAAALRPEAVRRSPLSAALAAGFVLFIAGVAAFYRFNDWLGRFMLVPMVAAAPLLASIYRRRPIASGVAALALATLALTNAQNELKPLKDRPWLSSRAEIFGLQAWQDRLASGVEALDRTVPEEACTGALLGGDDAAYPLFGAHLRRRISYVAAPAPGHPAEPGENAVIVGPGARGISFGPGWRVTSLGGYWRLATRRSSPRPFSCPKSPG